MQTLLIKSRNVSYLILGSNGNIGSIFVQAIKNLENTCLMQHRLVNHKACVYPNVAYRLLEYVELNSKLCIIYAAGKGGFSIDKDSAHQQSMKFNNFCDSIRSMCKLSFQFVLISSLGARVSRLPSPYVDLISNVEESSREYFGNKLLLLRLPSMYGKNQVRGNFHGLIGKIYSNLRIRNQLRIYAKQTTIRNFVSSTALRNFLMREVLNKNFLFAEGAFNIYSVRNYSIEEVCQVFFSTLCLKPNIYFCEPVAQDSENHYNDRVDGIPIVLEDHLKQWILATTSHPAH